ncbi:Beta-mannosidase B [Hyphodiscus hymeniophilus]|uniref:Beta-mannosidase B n=1 Tax=Hyphodiscus hymeniophilus TaxID=353542 RepID=A0A9P6VM08_9HELO|nr:Beta-mannosidase B [Hyphodiscus hymeniophilus]
MPLQKILLDKEWHFKQATTLNNSTASSFLPCAQFPTVAHIDLLHHKLIPDPYIDTNELNTLWVNEANWTYQTKAIPPVSFSSQTSRATLVFDGLDTIVSVYLNEKLILESQNMHISHRVDVTDLLKQHGEKESILELRFQNAPAYARKEWKRIGYKGNGTDVHFGGPERLFVRKAQYHWGWDWGPAVNTSGPWKEIWLETFESKIDDFIVRQEVAADLKSAQITVKGTVEGVQEGGRVVIGIKTPDGVQAMQSEVPVDSKGGFTALLKLDKDLQLWYPFTYGSQPLYTITASLSSQHSISQKLGLRRLKLLQHPLKKEPGTAFVFSINNTPIFAGGSCWIPGDFMLPRMSRQRYEDWLLLAKAGNQTMIRVWGGGIVESDHFYEICDREGILVWQDFLFACGDYPASDDFIEKIKIEATQQIKRVGYHASLAIWAGNNEDYMLAERWGWEYDIDDQKGPWDKTNFPAREIYERVLPKICEDLAGDVPYWRSSPYGGKTSNDTTVGDTHIWDVWHGKMSPYQDYKAYTSRFVSEFGFESAPNIRTLHKAITVPSERHWQSRTFDAHDKGPGHERRYGMYSGENFRFKMNPLSSFVYTTQFLQAEAMSYAYNHWRREFRGPGEENCSGILVWQLNDIWPGTSWALVDVDFHRKPSFYITKRALAKVVVGMERVVTEEPSYITMGYLPKKGALDVWAVNGVVEELDAVLRLFAFDIESGKAVDLPEDQRERTLKLKGNQTTEITRLDIPNPEQTVIAAYIDDPKTGERLARWVSWPEPLKFVRFKKDLKMEATVDGDTVVLKSNGPAKGVVISVPIEAGDDAIFDDNFVDVVPGEEIKIGVKGLDGRKIETRFLCDWELEEGFEL